MSYLGLASAVLVCVAILGVPGLILGLALRLRGLWLAAAAPALGLTALATAAIIAPAVGLSWGMVVVIGVAVAAAALIAVAVWRFPQLRPRRGARSAVAWAAPLAVALGAGMLAVQLLRVTGSPEAFSQSYDNVFHLNAVRWVLDTESASPFMLGRMTSPEGALGFYPSAWHGLAALVVQLTGVSIPVAVNALMFTVACLVWPLGAVVLTRTLFGNSTALTLAAGALAAAFPTFPLLLLNYGVLYPMFLAYAILPIALAGLVRLVGSVRREDGITRPVALLLLIGIVPGMAVAHPGALVSLLAFSVPVVMAAAVRMYLSKPPRRTVVWLSAALGAYLLMGVVALQIVRPPADQIYWPIEESPGQAIGEVLTASVYFTPIALVVAVLVLVGIVTVVRRGGVVAWTAVGLWLMAGTLYVIVAASSSELLRLLVTGPWYNNIPRLAALYPLVALPLAASGAAVVWRIAAARLRLRALPRAARGAVAAVTLIVLAVTTQGSAIRDSIEQARGVYAIGDDSWMLTPDEMEMFDRVAEIVPEGDVIGGNPWTGAGLAYAFSGRWVLMPHLLMDIDPDLAEFLDGFDTAAGDDPACAATRRLGVDWVLDFGDQQINNADNTYEGLDELERSPNVELVEEIGDARLYRIIGCGEG